MTNLFLGPNVRPGVRLLVFPFVGVLALQACSGGGDGVDPSTAATETGDGGNGTPEETVTPSPPSRDRDAGSAGCPTACADGSVCDGDECVAVPTTCPCPKESYCDLATNSCKVGCTEEGQCSAGRYCDVDSRTCKTGCLKEDSECGPGLLCEDHACTAPCTSCPDDGNPCTTDQCVRSKCVHAPVTDGTACAADTNECTVDGCQAGACAHLPPIDFTKCETGSWASDPKFGTPIVHACDGTVCVAPKAYCQKVTNLYFSSTGASLQECYCAKNDTLVLRDENGYPTSVVGTFCGVIGGPTTLIAVW